MAGDAAHAVLGILQHIGLFAFFGAGAVFAMIKAVTVLPGVPLDGRTTMLALVPESSDAE